MQLYSRDAASRFEVAEAKPSGTRRDPLLRSRDSLYHLSRWSGARSRSPYRRRAWEAAAAPRFHNGQSDNPSGRPGPTSATCHPEEEYRFCYLILEGLFTVNHIAVRSADWWHYD